MGLPINKRIELLAGLASGDVTFRDLAGLKTRDVATVASLARAAFEAEHFVHAALLFSGLEALEGDTPVHALNRAHSESRAGDKDAALESVTRYLDNELPRERANLIDALKLRAILLAPIDKVKAALDLRAADIIAGGAQ